MISGSDLQHGDPGKDQEGQYQKGSAVTSENTKERKREKKEGENHESECHTSSP